MILLWSARFSSGANPDEIVLSKQEERELDDFHSKYEFADNTKHTFMI